jgi:poly[(R)-3-hydroxyalkanoate] polymerase subunit PhaC
VSEPGHAGRSFRVGHKDHHYLDPARFLAEAQRKDGSWWPEWAGWLSERSGAPTVSQTMGAPHAGYPVVGEAPGSYVFQQ